MITKFVIISRLELSIIVGSLINEIKTSDKRFARAFP